ncbi:MAG: hypothetical protein ACRBCJ_08805 [Hyphomicrobiaceae bacterium]
MLVSETTPGVPEPIQCGYEAKGVSLDPATIRLLQNIPENVRYSFTTDQLAGLSAANLTPQTSHFVDYCASIPWFGRRFYIRMLLGTERRNRTRLRSEGQISLPKTSILFFAIIFIVSSLALFGSVIVLYLIKSTMGINLLDGPSVLHPIFFS